ncbi:MAG TPA: hypothetical protein VHP38_14440, partial [Ruminiclostridium sp.]|nr:hypothetical protein [Ruminiclostridium sp.]
PGAFYAWFVSLPLQGVWIEMLSEKRAITLLTKSLPLQGVWIEIIAACGSLIYPTVTPFAGSVD